MQAAYVAMSWMYRRNWPCSATIDNNTRHSDALNRRLVYAGQPAQYQSSHQTTCISISTSLTFQLNRGDVKGPLCTPRSLLIDVRPGVRYKWHSIRHSRVVHGLGWVHCSKSSLLKIWKDYFNAFKAWLDKISLHQAVKLEFMADQTGTGNWSEGIIKW